MTLLTPMSSAIFSPCRTWRYRLERETGRGTGIVVAGLMVNPSTADEAHNDHTIKKWYGFTRELGARRFIIGNKFAYAATDIRDLRGAPDPIGPDNDRHIEQILRDADIHIVAWGPTAKLPPHLRERWRQVVAIADKVGCRLRCWGTANDGQPLHPLPLAYDTFLVDWERPA